MTTRYDLESIKAGVDLLAIIGRDTPLKRKGNGPHGVEYAGACPLCGQATRDGFIVQPEAKPYPVWFCRKCTQAHNLTAVDYVSRRYNLDPKKGADLAEIVSILAGPDAPRATGATPAVAPKPVTLAPGQTWQTAAAAYIQYAEAQLWSPAGTPALAYLRGRGLADETIKHFRFGYNPTPMYRPASKWGTPNGEEKEIYLASGIVIPCTRGGEIWSINTRRLDGREPKYLKVRGSRGAIYNADDLRRYGVALFVEGELDAALAWQVIGTRVAVFSFGSGSFTPDLALWGAALYRPSKTLVLPDNDDAGTKTAAIVCEYSREPYLLGLPTQDKDLGDYYQAGGDVAAFLLDQLGAYDPVYSDVSALASELGATVQEV